MKRLLPALALVLVADAAFAFDPSPGKERIGLLRNRTADVLPSYARDCMIDALRDELRHRGFEAYEVNATFEEIEVDPDREADYYIDLIGHGDTDDYGGVGVGGRHAGVSLGVVVSRVAADMHLYRGRTLELLDTASLAKRNTAVLPTSIGIGGSDVFAIFAMPFVERAQVRSVARAAAREMAERVTSALRAE